jgi:hypothetical protein
MSSPHQVRKSLRGVHSHVLEVQILKPSGACRLAVSYTIMPDEDAQHKANIKPALCSMMLPGVCHAQEKTETKEY